MYNGTRGTGMAQRWDKLNRQAARINRQTTRIARQAAEIRALQMAVWALGLALVVVTAVVLYKL